MMRKNVLWGGIIVAVVGVAMVYASANLGWLTAKQTNFSDHKSTNHSNQLTAHVWDVLMDQLTTWAQNHESRLQVLAENTECHAEDPRLCKNLSEGETSFKDLVSTKHNNQLTSGMWDGLLSRLTFAITNHETRLRAVENKPDNPKCDIKPERGMRCEVGNQNIKVNDGPYSSFIQVKKTDGITPCSNSAGDIISYGDIGTYLGYFDRNNQLITSDRVLTNGEMLTAANYNLPPFYEMYEPSCYELYASMEYANIAIDLPQYANWKRVYKKYTGSAHPISDYSFMCVHEGNSCLDAVYGANCERKDIMGEGVRDQVKETCRKKLDKVSCSRDSRCQWTDYGQN